MRKQAYPKHLFINGSFWRVRFLRVIDKQPFLDGLACEERQTLFIRSTLSDHEKLRTFLHEILHALEMEYGIEMPHDLIYQLEGPLADLLSHNCWITWARWKVERGVEEGQD